MLLGQVQAVIAIEWTSELHVLISQASNGRRFRQLVLVSNIEGDSHEIE